MPLVKNKEGTHEDLDTDAREPTHVDGQTSGLASCQKKKKKKLTWLLE